LRSLPNYNYINSKYIQMLNKEKTVEPTSESGNDAKSIVRRMALEILAKYGTQTTVDELEEHVDDPNAVLKLSYCLEAIEAALQKPFA